MLAGEARRLRLIDGRRSRPLDKLGKPRWCPVWELCPDIARPNESGSFHLIRNYGGNRPYIDHPNSTKERWRWKDYRPFPANLNVKPDPRAAGMVLVEPHLKAGASPNKQWGRWQELVKHPHPWVQCGPKGTVPLPGVTFIETASIAEAFSVLAGCKSAVLPEGVFNHAAAALGVPSVVLFAGYIHPRNTGYDLHTNLAVDDPEASGWRIPHAACARAWQSITPELVLEKLEPLLGR